MSSSTPGGRPDPPLDPLSFLRQTPPFDGLAPAEFEIAASALEIAFYPNGTRISGADGRPSEGLYLVRKGLVRLERGGETALILEEGEFFGYSILTGTVGFDAVVEEDLLAYRISEDAFRRLLADPGFARFFTLSMADRLRGVLASGGDTALGGDVLVPVGRLVERPPVTAPPDVTVGEVARLMRDENVASIILLSEPPAIVTSRDLTKRVLAAGLGPEIRARTVASAPIRSVPHSTPAYGALQAMLEHGVNHLPVQRDGKLVGIVTSTDLLRHQSHGPLLAFKRVERMRDNGDLAGHAADVTRTTAMLMRTGLPATEVARLISHLSDAVVRKLLSWAERDLGPPPCPYAFLVFGSEGRFEQTLLTDQDNALVYADETEGAAAYFEKLTGSVISGLLAAGFPPCPGGFMATRWRGPLEEWEERFWAWIETPRAEAILQAVIFFDFRAVGGSLDLSPLDQVIARARGNAPFLSHLAREAVRFRPPIGAFRRLELDQGGIDLKKGGIAPIQGLARVWALDAGVRPPSTVDRLRAAVPAGLIDRETAEALVEAYVYLLGLRLREQLKAVARGKSPGDKVTVASLTPVERRHLKEAFLAVRTAQSEAVDRYQVSQD